MENKRAKMWYDDISIAKVIFTNIYWNDNEDKELIGKDFPKNIQYIIWEWKYQHNEKSYISIGVELENRRYARITYDQTNDIFLVTPCYDEETLNDLKPQGLREKEWADDGNVEWEDWDGDEGYRFDIADEV
jgi:hypothetical protein